MQALKALCSTVEAILSGDTAVDGTQPLVPRDIDLDDQLFEYLPRTKRKRSSSLVVETGRGRGRAAKRAK